MARATMISLKSSVIGAALFSAMCGPALAVDGVILIDQNKAFAGNVTPGDAAGFPVTISQPGSYRLSGNLTVPNSNTTAIEITASHVTLDLNGFAILGTTNCTVQLNPCTGAGSGFGILTLGGSRSNITIRNGTIQGMGSQGVTLLGDSHLVEYLHVRSNGGGGIGIGSSADGGGSIVQHNTVQRNGAAGIGVNDGMVRYNVVDANLNAGIFLVNGSASYNRSNRNGVGLALATLASYIGNVLVGNTSEVTGGINLGQNLCANAACPGAQF